MVPKKKFQNSNNNIKKNCGQITHAILM